MTSQTLYGIALLPAIIGLVQVTKQIGVPSRFAPLVAVALGIAGGFAQFYSIPNQSGSWIQAAVLGIALGLAASGLYSGVTSSISNSGSSPSRPNRITGSRVRRPDPPRGPGIFPPPPPNP